MEARTRFICVYLWSSLKRVESWIDLLLSLLAFLASWRLTFKYA
jgi:hypothetical protein